MNIIDQFFRTNPFMNTSAKQQAEKSTFSGRSVKSHDGMLGSDTPGMDKIDALLKMADRPVSEQGVKAVDSFMRLAEGSTSSKLETIEWAIDKGVELTDKNLQAIHESLNSDMNEAELVRTLSGAQENADKAWLEEVTDRLVRDPQVPDEIKSALKDALEKGASAREALGDAVVRILSLKGEVKGNVLFLQGNGQASTCLCVNMGDIADSLLSALHKMTTDGNLAFEDAVKAALLETLGEAGVKALAERLLTEATWDTENVIGGVSDEGETDASADALIDEMEDAWMKRIEDSIEDVMEAFFMQNMVHSEAAGDPRLRSFIVEKVTHQAVEAKQTFSQVKKEITQALRAIATEDGSMTKQEMSENLSKAISKLDNMIMKSEVTLFTSMKMERDLIGMSSTLQEARKLMARGDLDQALRHAEDVRAKLDRMLFRPAERNIQLMAGRQAEALLGAGSSMPALEGHSSSARGVLELLRQLGVNNEPEAAERIMSQSRTSDISENYKIRDNLKAVLMRMVENEEPDQKRSVAAAQKALNNLTGQQLMNRLETKQETQTLFFHIPVRTGDEIKDMRLFVNARKNGDAIDWENSSLYFSVELSRYGETGIHIQTVDRRLSVSVLSDHPTLEPVLRPVISSLQKEFVDVGYKLGPVSFSPLSKSKSAREIMTGPSTNSASTPRGLAGEANISSETSPEKGFDFSI